MDQVLISVAGIFPVNNGLAVFFSADKKVFVIQVDASVGISLKSCVIHKKNQRPLTHDLIENIFTGFGVEMQRAVVVDMQDDVYFCRLNLVQKNELGQKIVELDACPSDCLVLCLMLKKPFYILRSVLDPLEDMSSVLEKLKQQRGSEGEDESVE